MIITQSQKTNKFTISGITETELINLALRDEVLRPKIKQALIDSMSEEETLEEYGYGREEFLRNLGL